MKRSGVSLTWLMILGLGLFAGSEERTFAVNCSSLLQAWIKKVKLLPLGPSKLGRPVEIELVDRGVVEMVDLGSATRHYAEVGPGTEIRSGVVGPCIALVIYNRKTKRAHAAHLVPGSVSAELERDFDRTMVSLGTVSDLEVYVTGSAAWDGHRRELITRDREEIFTWLQKSGFAAKKVYVSWSEPESDAELTFNTSTGVAYLERHRD